MGTDRTALTLAATANARKHAGSFIGLAISVPPVPAPALRRLAVDYPEPVLDNVFGPADLWAEHFARARSDAGATANLVDRLLAGQAQIAVAKGDRRGAVLTSMVEANWPLVPEAVDVIVGRKVPAATAAVMASLDEKVPALTAEQWEQLTPDLPAAWRIRQLIGSGLSDDEVAREILGATTWKSTANARGLRDAAHTIAAVRPGVISAMLACGVDAIASGTVKVPLTREQFDAVVATTTLPDGRLDIDTFGWALVSLAWNKWVPVSWLQPLTSMEVKAEQHGNDYRTGSTEVARKLREAISKRLGTGGWNDPLSTSSGEELAWQVRAMGKARRDTRPIRAVTMAHGLAGNPGLTPGEAELVSQVLSLWGFAHLGRAATEKAAATLVRVHPIAPEVDIPLFAPIAEPPQIGEIRRPESPDTKDELDMPMSALMNLAHQRPEAAVGKLWRLVELLGNDPDLWWEFAHTGESWNGTVYDLAVTARAMQALG